MMQTSGSQQQAQQAQQQEVTHQVSPMHGPFLGSCLYHYFILISSFQMLQTAQGHQIIQANGQQLVLQTLAGPQNGAAQTIQVAANGGEGLQQIQVLPAGNQQIMLQQPATAATAQQQPQVIITADGQALSYQPVQVADGSGGAATVVQQQTIQQGNQLIQLTNGGATQVQQVQGQSGNVMMIVPGTGGTNPSIQRIPLPGKINNSL